MHNHAHVTFISFPRLWYHLGRPRQCRKELVRWTDLSYYRCREAPLTMKSFVSSGCFVDALHQVKDLPFHS